jgi:acetyl/propionyl-CoA carboxylase alpha subunit
VRVDSGVTEGSEISPLYDPMIAKLIVRGETRAEAVAKLRTALHEFDVQGIKTNIPFLRRLVDSEGFRTGEFDTGWVPRFLSGDAS